MHDANPKHQAIRDSIYLVLESTNAFLVTMPGSLLWTGHYLLAGVTHYFLVVSLDCVLVVGVRDSPVTAVDYDRVIVIDGVAHEVALFSTSHLRTRSSSSTYDDIAPLQCG